MRQGNWRVAAVGLLAMSLLWSPAFAGDYTASDQPVKDAKSKVIAESRDAGSGQPVPSLTEQPMGPWQPEPSALDDKYDLVHDNRFALESGGIIQAGQCETMECNAPVGILADDITLPNGTVVNGFKMRFGFRNPNITATVDGVLFTIWPDCGDSPPCHDGGSAGGEPGNAGTAPAPGYLERFTVAASDPGFALYDEGAGGLNRRIEAEFNPGDEWVADGNTYWVSTTPVVDFPPQTFAFMSLFPLGMPGWQSFNPVSGARPWGDNPEAYPGELIYDQQFQLWGQRPIGGTNVVTIYGSATATCTVRLRVSQQGLSSCTPGECPDDPVLGGTCRGSAVVTAGMTASQVAAAIAADFTANAVCGGTVGVTMVAEGPRVIVETDDGARPAICLQGDAEADRLVGGSRACIQTGCGFSFQVGLRGADHVDPQILPPIGPGMDWLTSDRSCTTEDGAGTWAELADLGGTTAGLFDRPGLPATDPVSPQRIAMRGIGQPYGNHDTDTIVERVDPVIFGLCSGDFINAGAGGATIKNPDGTVDADDLASFTACLGNYGLDDCAFFDYDGDLDVDADDQDVFNCLLASHNNTACCPENTNYPQTVLIATTLRRLHLRSCDPIEITRKSGQTKGMEFWWIDHYLSGIPPGTTTANLGTPCTHEDAEHNDIASSAVPLGLLGRETPIRVWGSISDTNCDVGAPAGQWDADAYKFTVAYTDLVVVTVRANEECNDICEAPDPGECACNAADPAVPDVYIFDESGSSLLGSDTPPITPAEQEPIPTCSTQDPSTGVVLAPGTYLVLVTSANQINVPDPTGDSDVIHGHTCSVYGPDPPYDGFGPTTGDYELNLAVVDRSTMWVTQTDEYGGTFDSKLLVQSLVTFQRTADPNSVVVIDTGELGQDAIALWAFGEGWVKELTPGDPEVEGIYVNDEVEDFVAGISHVGTDQDIDPIQHYNDDATQANSTVVHLVLPPVKRECVIIEDGCAFIQGPNDVDADAIGAARSATLDFPAADDFSVDEDTTIYSVTFWLVGATDTNTDHVFDINFYGDGGLDLCASGPVGAPLASFLGLAPEVIRPTMLNDADRVTFNLEGGFVADAGVTYWMEVVQDVVEGPGQVFFMLSDAGDGAMFRDLDPIGDDPNADEENDTCPDWTLEGDGWDCDEYVDDEGGTPTPDCREDACGNGDINCQGTAYPGDRINMNLAFCLGRGGVQAWTKDLPEDVASGNWHLRAGGGIIWNQPASGGAGNLNDVSDRRMPSNNDLGQQIADDFTFYVETTITDLHWRGRYDTSHPDVTIPLGDQFAVEIWDDESGSPNSRLYEWPAPQAVTRVAGRLTGDPGWQIFDYYLDISGDPWVAAANTTYWLSIINDSTGSARYWFWVRSDGGRANGSSAQRDIGDPWVMNAWDKSFDLTYGSDEEKIIAVKSVDCDPIQATGVGYYFDSTHCYINGFQPKQGDPEAHENRWRAVRAPWKYWDDAKLPPDTYPGDLDGVLAAFAAAGIEPPPNPECLVGPEYETKYIQGVFEGLAAYDITNDFYGIEVGGILYRECNGQIIETAGDPSDVINPDDESLGTRERLHVRGVMFDQVPPWEPDSGVATAQMTVELGPQCFDAFHCTRCNVCFRESCTNQGVCTHVPNIYGDVDASGAVGVYDIFRVLDGFAGDYTITTKQDVDISPCGGNDDVGIYDLFAVLNAFGGGDPCCYCAPPVPTDPACVYGAPPACPAPEPDRSVDTSLSSGRGSSTVNIKAVPSQRTAQAGDLVDIDFYVMGATNLRGYQLAGKVDGGRRGGNMILASVSIDERKDYVLNTVENYRGIDERGAGGLLAAAMSGGVSTEQPGYLGTLTYEVPADAAGAFRFGLGDKTVLLDADGSTINIGRMTQAVVMVSRGR